MLFTIRWLQMFYTSIQQPLFEPFLQKNDWNANTTRANPNNTYGKLPLRKPMITRLARNPDEFTR